MIEFQDEWRRQKAQLIATLERIWAKNVAWTTPTTASLDNRQGHLNTELKLNTSKKCAFDHEYRSLDCN